MSTSEDKVSILELGAGLIVFAGLLVGALNWWWGETLWDSLMLVFLFVVVGGLVALSGQGLRTGKLEIKGGSVRRDKNPVMFWGCLMFYLGVAVFFLILFLFG